MVPVPVFKKITGNEYALGILSEALKNRRLAYCYIFAGQEGVGKKIVALEFAKNLLCQKADPDYCDRCQDCKLVDKLYHQNLFLLTKDPEKQNISIDLIRQLQERLRLKPVHESFRIVIIDDADRLSEEAMNAMLKILEQPPDGCIFILIATHKSMLTETIVSRSQIILFHSLRSDDIRRYLKDKGLSDSDAKLVYYLSGGSIGKAIELSNKLGEIKQMIKDTLEKVATKDFNYIAEKLAKGKDPQESREKARLILDILISSVRDIIHSAINDRYEKVFGALSQNFARVMASKKIDDLIKSQETLMQARTQIDLNANVALCLSNAILKIYP